MYYLHDVVVPTRMLNAPAFDLALTEFGYKIDHSRRFTPENLTCLYYTKSYRHLPEKDRLKYNQLTGLGFCEQFIFLEEFLLVPAIKNVLASKRFVLSASLKEYLHRFIEDEYKHSELFWRVLEKADPQRYKTRKLHLCGLEPWMLECTKILSAAPSLLHTWMWMAVLFEERTIDIFRKYRADKQVEPLFAKAHELHMSEEVFHVDMDRIFIDACYAKSNPVIRMISAKFFAKIMARFTAPRRIAKNALMEISETSTATRLLMPQLLNELKQLRCDTAYHEAIFPRKACPQTFALMDRFPEMKRLEKVLLSYAHQGTSGQAVEVS